MKEIVFIVLPIDIETDINMTIMSFFHMLVLSIEIIRSFFQIFTVSIMTIAASLKLTYMFFSCTEGINRHFLGFIAMLRFYWLYVIDLQSLVNVSSSLFIYGFKVLFNKFYLELHSVRILLFFCVLATLLLLLIERTMQNELFKLFTSKQWCFPPEDSFF